MAGKPTTDLAHLNQIERALAKAKTVAEFKTVGTGADAFHAAIKKMGASRKMCNKVMDYFIRTKIGIGKLLGPPPGQGVGGGRGNKLSTGIDSLPNDVASQCARLFYQMGSRSPKKICNRICVRPGGGLKPAPNVG